MIICGTGHRPDKLGGYSPEVFENLKTLAHMYLCVATDLERVVSGGALGWDQALAATSLDLNIPTTLALPFPGFEDRWPEESKSKLHALMHRADKVVFVKEGPYAGWKMQARNEWMVNNSDKVLALWNGTEGGTANCVRYAKKVGKPIINLWDTWNSERN
jgi:uncharacterized phage-like protein YoqJ